MRLKKLSEVRSLVAAPEFHEWWDQLLRARAALAEAQERYDEFLSQTTLMEFRAELTQKNAIDTLYQAGEAEDTAANMLSQVSELENQSFRAVSDFEELRFKVSELWYRLGATEKDAEEKREAQRRSPSAKSEAALKGAERALRQASEEYERETTRKNALWEEVERIWSTGAELGLLVSEHRLRGKKIRRAAEQLFAQAEERKRRAQALRREAEQMSQKVETGREAVRSLLSQARERFGCATGTDFLYFRHRDSQKQAYCIPLVEDKETYNVEVKPLSVYSVERQRGVGFLEPARSETVSNEEGDRRFEEYFLKGRKGT